MNLTLIQSLLATVALLDLELLQMDVVTALLRGEAIEDVYNEVANGAGVYRKSIICKLG